MKQFIITEEERNRILNLHEERTSKHYLMEQTTGTTQSTGTTQTSGSTPTLVSGPFGNPDRKQYVYNVNGKFFIYYTTPANSTPVPEKGNPFTNNGQGFATEGQATAKIKQMTPSQEELDRQQDINRSSYSDTEVNEELIEGYENSLYSDIMELIHDSNSSHEETIDVLNSIVDEMSSSRRTRRNVERRFRDDMNEDSLYSDSREDISYDIESVDCVDEMSGYVDIDEDDTIIIRYCEGDDDDLEYLKEKGKRLLYRKYGM